MTAVVISGHKVLLLVMDEHRVAHVMVFPPACIHTILVEVHIVEGFMRNGPVCKPVFTMERHELRALRKTNLVILVDQRRYIRPIKHRIVILSGIDQTSTDLHIGFPRTERDSDRPLHPMAILSLAKPDRLRAVAIIDNPPVTRNMAGLAVMVEGIPLYATTDPRSGHSHIGRLDHAIPVKDVVTVGLVDGIQQPASDLREYAQLHILVLHIETIVGHILLLTGHVVIERIGIDTSFGALVGPVPFKDRGLFRRIQEIGRKRNRTLIGSDILSRTHTNQGYGYGQSQ